MTGSSTLGQEARNRNLGAVCARRDARLFNGSLGHSRSSFRV